MNTPRTRFTIEITEREARALLPLLRISTETDESAPPEDHAPIKRVIEKIETARAVGINDRSRLAHALLWIERLVDAVSEEVNASGGDDHPIIARHARTASDAVKFVNRTTGRSL